MSSSRRIDPHGHPFTAPADDLTPDERRAHLADVTAEIGDLMAAAEPPNSMIPGRWIGMLHERQTDLFEAELDAQARFVRQPDGRFAYFSASGNDFTSMNMVREEALALASGQYGTLQGPKSLRRAEIPAASSRWNDALELIRRAHGVERAERRVQDSKQPVAWT